jgi:hypothetical protein
MATKQKTGLAWILPEASRLQKQYPRRFGTWQEYVEQATAIYHSKKGDPMPKKKTTRKTGHSRTKKRPAKKRGPSHAVGKAAHLPHGTVAFHMRHVKLLLEKKIGDLEASKLRAKNKTALRKIQKKVAAAKVEYRRLS